MSEYFPRPKFLGGKVKVELDLFNYATRADSKNSADIDTFKFFKIVDLARLKSEVDRLDIEKLEKVSASLNSLESKVDKLVPVPVDLGKVV